MHDFIQTLSFQSGRAFAAQTPHRPAEPLRSIMSSFNDATPAYGPSAKKGSRGSNRRGRAGSKTLRSRLSTLS